jgi:hypothetical protein
MSVSGDDLKCRSAKDKGGDEAVFSLYFERLCVGVREEGI